MAEKIFSSMDDKGKPVDFVLCIGDDRSDEDMFESILNTVTNPDLPMRPEIFACTVGRKPSKAKYFLDDVTDVLKLLEGLGAASSSSKPEYGQESSSSSSQTHVAFESII